MSELTAQSGESADTPSKLTYDYVKGNMFRVVHVDGAVGGPSLNGDIHMAVFSERRAIPQKVVYQLNDGILGEEILAERKGKNEVIREVEVDCVMSLPTAIAMRNWLSSHIERLQGVPTTRIGAEE